jgi:glycosyltransferase involved in cell wall biosynthesis
MTLCLGQREQYKDVMVNMITRNDIIVSVIMPTYNRGYLISRAINSVLAQTCRYFELIIIDDGSTDDTKEVVGKFDDKRIVYVRHEKNRGAEAARNTGINVSKGEYIAFLDSDDEWLPSKIDEQLVAFKGADLDVGAVYSEMLYVHKDKVRYLHGKFAVEGDIYKYVLGGYPIYLQTLMVKREFLERVGVFDEDMLVAGDFDFCIRLSKITKFKYVRNHLVIRYIMSDSISVGSPVVRGLERILSKHINEIQKDHRILALHYARLASYSCLSKDLVKGRRYYIKAIKSYPLDVRSILGLIASIFGHTFYKWAIELFHKVKRTDN